MPHKAKRENDVNDEPPREKHPRRASGSRQTQGLGGSSRTYDNGQGPAGGGGAELEMEEMGGASMEGPALTDGGQGAAEHVEMARRLPVTNDGALQDVIETCLDMVDHWKGREEVGEAGIGHLDDVTTQFIESLRNLRGRKTIMVGQNSVGKSWILNIMMALTVRTQAEYKEQVQALTRDVPADRPRDRLFALCEKLDPATAEEGLGDAVIHVAPHEYLQPGAKKDLVEFRKQLIKFVDGAPSYSIETDAFAPFVLPCMSDV